MGVFTSKQLASICPRCPMEKLDSYARAITAAAIEAQATTLTRLAMFVGQWAHETGEFRWMLEQDGGAAYEGRKDLGNTQPGDGPRYKGRGPAQLTGRDNYKACGAALGLPLEERPEMVEDPAVGFRAAGWYWTTHKLNALADQLDIIGATRAINGGVNGLEHRISYYHKALEVLGRDAFILSAAG